VVITYNGRRDLLTIRMSARDGVLTRVAGGPISAAPPGESLGGMLFEIVEKREGMRGRRPRVAICSRICERLEALILGPSAMYRWADGPGMNLRV
jgi:hypothetical protein